MAGSKLILALLPLLLGAARPASLGSGAATPAAVTGQPVRIVTDRWGVPHLAAATLPDLYFAWGYVTARDRMWELEITRRSAEGRLWEWFGNATLTADGGAELFEFRERAARAWELQRRDPATAMALERYAAGINRYLDECRSGQSPWREEFLRVGHTPEPWKPQDSLLEMLGFGVLLDLDLPELAEGQTIAEHGREWLVSRSRFDGDGMYDTVPDSAARRLYGPVRPRPSPRSARSPEVTPALLAAAQRAVEGLTHAGDRDEADRASNVFAAGAGRSRSKAPLLANDPHLALGAPGPLHLIHVTVPGVVDAIGAAPVGIPAIVSGRNARCAWGITALSADVVDVYADTLSADGKRVRWKGGWAPVRTKDFSLRYRALGIPLPPVGRVRRYTPHGPVVGFDPRHRVALSVRWTALERPVSLSRLIGVERAADAAEVCERYRSLVTPGLNIVAADVGGTVRYQAVGLVPRRRADPGPGPVPGNDPRFEWNGFIAATAMPAWSPPRDGFVVNANNRPVGPPYPELLPRYDWFHDRARRIAQRLAGDSSLTTVDLASIQNDVHSLAADRLLPNLIAAADSVASTPAHFAALDTLRHWDRLARRDRVGPTLYRGWVGAFTRRSGLDGTPGLLAATLDGRAPEALRDARGYPERPAEAALRSLEVALDSLQARLGHRLETWRYGRAHQAVFKHRLAARDAAWQPAPQPADGDNSTPCVGASSLPWRTSFTHGAVFRHIVDLAVPESSLAALPPGNHGDRRDPHARDLLRSWANHGYIPLHLSWARIERVKESEITLAP